MNCIEIDKLCFRYDSREVLHNICLDIEEGMFAAMVGPNGGGKTTLLKLILGLLQPRYGTISVLGKSPKQARQDIGYVPQSIQYDPAFPASVLDIVLMGRVERHLCGLYAKQDKDVARHALEQVGLDNFGKRHFSELSGGERQRVLIAQALASEPRLLLLDEPGANLDPISAQNMFKLLATLNKNLTILMVSHNLEVVSNLVSHVICINHTADMHHIKDINAHNLTDAWLHLNHDNCPVAVSYKTEPHHFHREDEH